MQCPNCDKTTFFTHKGVCLACAELGVTIKKKSKYNPARFSKKVIAKTYSDNPGKNYRDYLNASREDYAREYLRRRYATYTC